MIKQSHDTSVCAFGGEKTLKNRVRDEALDPSSSYVVSISLWSGVFDLTLTSQPATLVLMCHLRSPSSSRPSPLLRKKGYLQGKID